MRTIHKYELSIKDVQRLSIPGCLGAKNFKDQFLKIDVVDNRPYLWCMVDVPSECRNIEIRIVGTGHTDPIIGKETYLDSFMLHSGALVYHVFYIHVGG